MFSVSESLRISGLDESGKKKSVTFAEVPITSFFKSLCVVVNSVPDAAY